jgi:hypothetical protein
MPGADQFVRPVPIGSRLRLRRRLLVLGLRRGLQLLLRHRLLVLRLRRLLSGSWYHPARHRSERGRCKARSEGHERSPRY